MAGSFSKDVDFCEIKYMILNLFVCRTHYIIRNDFAGISSLAAVVNIDWEVVTVRTKQQVKNANLEEMNSFTMHLFLCHELDASKMVCSPISMLNLDSNKPLV